MERTKNIRKPDLIISSDWHLREDTPICRTDDFWAAQWKKVLYIKELQYKYQCPVFHAGDLFHHWKPSPHLLSTTIDSLPEQFHTILGQHDIPQHNLQLADKSGVHTLYRAGKLQILPECHYGQDPTDETLRLWIPIDETNDSFKIDRRMILVWHHLTYITKPFPDASGGMAEGILRKYPQFDLIITGDNHQSFWVNHAGRLLVNPGSLTRQTADQAEFKPRVYLWYADTNTVQSVYLPIEEGVISREHIDHKEEHDKRIDAFISKLDGDWQVELSFEQNLKAFFEKNNIRDLVKELIFKAIEQ